MNKMEMKKNSNMRIKHQTKKNRPKEDNKLSSLLYILGKTP